MIEYVISAYLDDLEERRYRAYITDALMTIAENTARYAGGKVLSVRWAEKFMPVDNRSGEEIAMEVIKNAGLIYNGGE